ncbi:hypothetical protein BGP_6332 [Beggiatoa sp. PS]|nr:hypothetical protein BGP_6332 [Beggiatoa sp. PS]
MVDTLQSPLFFYINIEIIPFIAFPVYIPLPYPPYERRGARGGCLSLNRETLYKVQCVILKKFPTLTLWTPKSRFLYPAS